MTYKVVKLLILIIRLQFALTYFNIQSTLLHLQAIICIDDSQRVSYFFKLSVADIRKLIWSYVCVVVNFRICFAR